MDIQKYISSGVLEAYVLGDLLEAELNEVERLAELHPEIKDEITLIEESLRAIGKKTAIEPPVELKNQILGQIDRMEDEESGDEKPSRVIPIEKAERRWRFLVAASVTIALISMITAINYYQKWKSTEVELEDLITQNQRLAENFDQVNRQFDKAFSDLQILKNKDFSEIELKGLEISPESLVLVYWNQSSREVYLNINSLPVPDKDKQYQLWAIVDGKPVDIGVFEFDLSGIQKMKDITNAAAFAITLEPLGGSVSPTLEAMYVLGNV